MWSLPEKSAFVERLNEEVEEDQDQGQGKGEKEGRKEKAEGRRQAAQATESRMSREGKRWDE